MKFLIHNRHDLAAAVAAIGGLALLLAFFAFGRSASREQKDELVYTQAGAFRYAATATASDLYDRGSAGTGDPVFRKLSDPVEVGFAYELASALAPRVAGTARLDIEVAESSGWKRTLQVAAPVAATGTRVDLSGVLSLSEVKKLTDRFEAETGLDHPIYTLTIVPHIELAGTLAGEPLKLTFAPRLLLKLDQLQLSLPARSEETADPTTPSTEGRLVRVTAVPNTLPILWADLDVAAARVLSVVLLVLALVAAAALAAALHRGLNGEGPAGENDLRYAAMLVPIRRRVSSSHHAVVEVTDLESLARIAEREATVILKESAGGHATYLVESGGVLYWYDGASATPLSMERAA